MAENKKITSAPKVTVEKEVIEKKRFKSDEFIDCISITPGKLHFEGAKTKNLYTWADIDDVVPLEYQDLAYAARSKDKIMYKPRFIVMDKDFLKEFPALEDLYGTMYSADDLKAILKLPASQMEKAIKELPEGAKDALQTLVSTMIDNGTFDSIKRIQKLDEIFDTKMLMRLVQD